MARKKSVPEVVIATETENETVVETTSNSPAMPDQKKALRVFAMYSSKRARWELWSPGTHYVIVGESFPDVLLKAEQNLNTILEKVPDDSDEELWANNKRYTHTRGFKNPDPDGEFAYFEVVRIDE